MKRTLLMFAFAALAIASIPASASAGLTNLELVISSTLPGDLPILIDVGDGVDERTLQRSGDLHISEIASGTCARIWTPSGPEPVKKSDCGRPPVKFWADCQTDVTLYCDISPARDAGAFNWNKMIIEFRRAPHGGIEPLRACGNLKRSGGKGLVFGIGTLRLPCRQARSTLKRWRGKDFTPEVGPQGWKCSITLSGQKAINHKCRSRGRTLKFGRHAY